MTWPVLIPSIIGVLTALGLCLRAMPTLLGALSKFVERLSATLAQHNDMSEDVRAQLKACREHEVESDKRIDMLEAQTRADAAVNERLFESLGVTTRQRDALRAEVEEMRRAEAASDHGSTMHRGEVS